MTHSPLRIGIAGLGTVGCGVVDILHNKATILTARTGRDIVITAVSARDKNKTRDISLNDSVTWHEDACALANDDNVDCVVELIGGSEGVAKSLCEAALDAGKHVITANKALIAHHGSSLATRADKAGLALLFEAAVAGGIPAIKCLKDAMAGNRISKVAGILNGTCNYILSTMQYSQRDFADVLAEAQTLGYAEADPTFDVDGVDAAHKLTILAMLAFGVPVAMDDVSCEGIRDVSAADINAARSLGYVIRLIGVATCNDNGRPTLRVHPALLPLGTALSHVDDVYNAVEIQGDEVGDIFIKGQGAGRRATASAVVSDIADVARGAFSPAFIVDSAQMVQATGDADHSDSAFYLRLHVEDMQGVLASITSTFSTHDISVATLMQQHDALTHTATITLTTHPVAPNNMHAALEHIHALPSVTQSGCLIRIA